MYEAGKLADQYRSASVPGDRPVHPRRCRGALPTQLVAACFAGCPARRRPGSRGGGAAIWTTGGARPCGRSVTRTTGSGHLTSVHGGPHRRSSLFVRRPNSRRSSPRTSSTPSAGARHAIKSMARPCTAASARCSRQGLSETWNGPGRGKLSRSTCGSPRSQSQGQQLWLLRPDHVLVSAALLRDTAQYQERLMPFVEALF